jgi:phosphoglycolate phosphatase
LKLVVFDCDGTLVDSQHMIVAAMDLAFERAGRPIMPRNAVLSVVGLSLTAAVSKLLPDAVRDEVTDLAESYKSAFAELRADPLNREPLYPGIRETIEALSRRGDVVLGIATGKSRRGVAAVLERENLGAYFHTIQTADTHPSKPHPAMLMAAITEAGAAAANTFMIGDTTYDMDMARDAGAKPIGVAWGYHPTDHLHHAGALSVVQNSTDLLAAIERHMAGLEPAS